MSGMSFSLSWKEGWDGQGRSRYLKVGYSLPGHYHTLALQGHSLEGTVQSLGGNYSCVLYSLCSHLRTIAHFMGWSDRMALTFLTPRWLQLQDDD